MDTTHDLLDQIAAVIEERDSLRARNQELDALSRRQGVVIARFADAMTELQAFLDETQLIAAQGTGLVPIVAPEPPAPEPEPAPQPEPAKGPSARRYTDDDAREWASALRQGRTQLEVAEAYGVTTTTIKTRLTRLGYDPKTGCIQDADPEPEPDAFAPTLETFVVYDDEEEDAGEPPFRLPANGNGHGETSDAAAAASS